MKRVYRIIPCLAVIALLACGTAASTNDGTPGAACETAFEPQAAGTGIHTNGVGINGVGLNGVGLNGVGLNGVGLNGVGLNGVGLNGVNLNGVVIGGASVAARLVGSRVVTADGADLPAGAKLSGVLTNGRELALDVLAADASAEDATVSTYRLAIDGQELCPSSRGVFVAGTWDASGAHHDGALVTYACTNAAIGKCVVWGYRPWTVGAEIHQACTRMVRADYCGNGVAHTKNGTTIDMFDAVGVQASAGRADLTFEAGWGPGGAVCVAAPRYTEMDAAGSVLFPSCWAGKPRCASFSDAQALGARLGDGSAHALRSVCGGGGASTSTSTSN